MKHLTGQLKRCEQKLAQETQRGKLYGPHYINGRRFRRRKFKTSIRNWNYWSSKWNGFACAIRDITDEYPDLPKECGGM